MTAGEEGADHRRLKIRHVINNLGNGGAERLVVELSKGMSERGHDVAILQLTPSPGNSSAACSADDAGVRTVVLGSHRFDPRAAWRLRRQVRGADIVHAHLFPAIYFTAWLGRARTVFTEHSTDNRRRHIRLFRQLDRLVLRRFDCCIAISDGVHRLLAAYLRSLGVSLRCHTIQNGIRLEDYSTAEPLRREGALKLIAVGTLDARKNMAEAIAAVGELSDVFLTVVGDGALRGRLKAQVDAFHQGRQVTFLGSRSDVPALLKEHHVLIMTSEYEGFGLVAVEAMASHLPVLAPDIPGVGQIVGHGVAGLLHGPHDIDQLRSNVERLRDDEGYRRQLAIGAHDRSRGYDVASCIDDHLALYASLLG